MRNIGAVILAAGGSTRLGRPKQLLRFRGETLVCRAVTAARAANCSPVVVVIGDQAALVRAELANNAAVGVENPDWENGMATSIRAGVTKLLQEAPETEAVLMLVCDQPLVDAAVIQSLVALRQQQGRRIVASRYSETLGVPALFDRYWTTELLALADDEGAKSIIVAHPEEVAEFPFPDGAIDVDTAADYEELVRSKS